MSTFGRKAPRHRADASEPETALIRSHDRAARGGDAQQQSLADKIACPRVIALLSIPDMPQILIRQLDGAIVRKLRAKAAAEGVSAEEEARRILRRSLVGDVPSMPLIDFLRTMPDVDDDSIFRRRKRKPRKVAL
jgi:plasmid stability protein